jgi:hypothetical protein
VARDVQIAGGVGAAPQSYTVPNATEILPRAVFATFNGAGAAGAFLPTVQIVSDGGVVVASVSTDAAVAAGGSASVTFAPFLRAAAAGGGGGIQFDTDPQTGGFLRFETTDTTAGSLVMKSDGTADLLAAGTLSIEGTADGELHTDDHLTVSSFGGMTIVNTSVGQFLIQSFPDDGFEILESGSAASRGIFIRSVASDVALEGRSLQLSCDTDFVYVFLGTGQRVQVKDSSNAPIFEVRDDGTIHGLASVGAITWDL